MVPWGYSVSLLGRQDAESAGGSPLLREGPAAFGDVEGPGLKMVPGDPDCSPVARRPIARLVPWVPEQTVSGRPLLEKGVIIIRESRISLFRKRRGWLGSHVYFKIMEGLLL